MTELQDARYLKDDLEAAIYPRRGRRITSSKELARIFAQTLVVMVRFRLQAQVDKHHMAWMKYHAENPAAVVMIADKSCKAAVDAAFRAIDVWISWAKEHKA